MFNVSPEETDELISRYVPQLGKKTPLEVVTIIKDSLKKFCQTGQNGIFNGNITSTTVNERHTSSKFHQHIISVSIRKDDEFLKNNKMTQLMKNLIGLPIHSKVLKENIPSVTMNIINYLIKQKSIYFVDDRIIINNSHPLVSAILVYIFCHIDNVLTIYYQHINNNKLNDGEFKSTYQKYLKANTEHIAEIAEVRDNKQKELEIAQNQISIDNVKMTQEELDGYSLLTERQKQEFLKRKILMDSRKKASKPLFITKRNQYVKPTVNEHSLNGTKDKSQVETHKNESENKSWSFWKTKQQKDYQQNTSHKTVFDKMTKESNGNDIYKSKDNDISFSSMSEHAYLNNPVNFF
jgi:hypothetical protein